MFKLSITGAFLVLLFVVFIPAGTLAATSEAPEEAEYLTHDDDLVQYVLEQRSNAQAEIIEHVVSRGETLSRIAKRYDVSVASICQNNNAIKNPNIIWPGLVLTFPAEDGLLHTVGEEDSVWSLAELYEVEPWQIILANGLVQHELVPGERVVIPGFVRPLPRPVSVSRTTQISTDIPSMMWPVQGRLTSFFGVPRGSKRHLGLDIAAKTGTPIQAAAAGRVIFSGWQAAGYGHYVVIEHTASVSTLYAHASKILVQRGAWVEKGETVALVGSTGNSTGPHLHFEVIVRGTKIDPLRVLPR